MQNFDRNNKNLIRTKNNDFLKIIKKPYNKRTSWENEALIEVLKKIKFFKKSQQQIEEVSKVFGYQINKPGEEVIRYGEYGDQFYIIMSGKVNVKVRNPIISDFKKHFDLYGSLKEWK